MSRLPLSNTNTYNSLATFILFELKFEEKHAQLLTIILADKKTIGISISVNWRQCLTLWSITVITCSTTHSIPNYCSNSYQNHRQLEGVPYFQSYSDVAHFHHFHDSLACTYNIDCSSMSHTLPHSQPLSYFLCTFQSHSISGCHAPDYSSSMHGPLSLVYKPHVL